MTVVGGRSTIKGWRRNKSEERFMLRVMGYWSVPVGWEIRRDLLLWRVWEEGFDLLRLSFVFD